MHYSDIIGLLHAIIMLKILLTRIILIYKDKYDILTFQIENGNASSKRVSLAIQLAEARTRELAALCATLEGRGVNEKTFATQPLRQMNNGA